VRPEKKKAHVDQYFWHVGFGISLFSAFLDPQQPQARNVCFATATEVAATTHGLAGHSHYLKRVRGEADGVNAVCARKNMILANSIFDAWQGDPVTGHFRNRHPKGVQHPPGRSCRLAGWRYLILV
jgi:hypothetical protein